MRRIVTISALLLASLISLAASGVVVGGGLSIFEDVPQAFAFGVRLGWVNLGDDEMLVDVGYNSSVKVSETSSPVSLVDLRLHFSIDLLGRGNPMMAGFYVDHRRTNLPYESTETTWRAETLAGIEVGGRFENFEITARTGYPLFSRASWNPFDTLVIDLRVYFNSERHHFRDWLLMGVELERRRVGLYLELVEPL